jgi:DUF4097 and DUF4098 domain-containing protein YvlB
MQTALLLALLAFLALPFAAIADRIDKQIPVTPGQRFDVDLRTGGSLTIHGSDDNTAVVTVEREDRDAGQTEVVVEATSGGGLRLATSFTGSRKTYSANLRIDVRLPRRFNVQLRSAGGTVHLDGLEGEFKGLTNGGKLELTNLRGAADLKTLGGDINVASSNLSGKVSTNGGNVVLDGVEGGLQGHSLGGYVTNHGVRGAKEPIARTASDPAVMTSMGGNLEVEEAPNGAELKTMGGNVRVGRADKFVKAHTMGGDIVIESVDGTVDAVTLGGNVTVTVAGTGAAGSHAVHLSSNAGELRLAVPADLAMDIDVQLFYTRDSKRHYRVHSDFPLKIEESVEWDASHGSPRKLIHATGRQGAASQRIELSTINGDVYITRAK